MADLGSAVGNIILNYQGDGAKQAIADVEQLGNASASAAKTAENVQATGMAIGAAGAVMGGAFLAGVAGAADYEQGLDRLGVAMGGVGQEGGVTEQQLGAVGDKVLQVASDTVFATGDIVDATEELARAGITSDQILDGAIDSTANFAAATGTNLPQAADMMSRTSAQWESTGLTFEQTADVMTNALGQTSLSAEDWQGGMANLGPTAKAVGEDIYTTAATLGYFKDQGLSAREAGTSLTSVLTGLAKPTDAAVATMNELGLAVGDNTVFFDDLTGEFIGLPATLEKINEATAGLTQEQKLNAISTMFSREALDVLNLTGADTEEVINGLAESFKAEGTAATQSAQLTDNVTGAWDNFKGTIGAVRDEAFLPLLPVIQQVIEGVTSLVGAIGTLPGPVLAAGAALLGLGGAAAGVASGLILAAPQLSKLKSGFQAIAASGKVAPILARMGPLLGALGPAALIAGAGILAYKTNFLGFGDAVDHVVGKAQEFGEQFQTTFGNLQAGSMGPMNGVQAAITALGVAFDETFGTSISDNVRSFAAEIGGVFDALGGAKDAFQDFQAMSELIGKGGLVSAFDGLAGALDSLGFEDAAQAVSDFGGVLENVGNTVGNTLGKLKDDFGLMISEGMDPLDAAVSALAESFPGLEGALGAISPMFRTLADTVGNVGGAIRDGLGAVLDGDLGTALQKVGDIAGSVVSGGLEMLGNAANLAGTALRGLGDFLGQADLGSMAEGIGNALQGASDAVGEAFNKMGTAISEADIPGKIGDALGDIGGFIEDIDFPTIVSDIGSGIQSAIETAGDFAGGIKDKLAAEFQQAFGELQGAIGELPIGEIVSGIGTAIQSAFENATEFAGGIKDKLVAEFQQAFDGVAGALGELPIADIVGDIGEKIKSAFETATEFAGGIKDALVSEFQQAFGELAGALPELPIADIVGKVGQALKDGFANFTGFAGGIKDALFTELTQAASELVGAITPDMFGNVAADVAGAFASAIGNAFDLLGTKMAETGEAIQGKIPGGEDSETPALDAAAAGTLGTELGTQLGKALTSDDFSTAMVSAIKASPTTGFQDTATAITEKLSQGIEVALREQGQIAPGDSGTGAEGGGMAAGIVTSLAEGMASSVDSADPAAFQMVGTALAGKIQESLATALQGVGDESSAAVTGAGGAPIGGNMGASIVTSLATSLQASIAGSDAGAFQLVGQALGAKIQESLALALQDVQSSTPVDAGGNAFAGGGQGEAIVTSLATSLAGSVAAVGPEAFAPVGLAIAAKLQESLAVAMQAGGEGSSAAVTGAGGGNTADGMGAGIVTAIATSLAASVTATGAEAFAPVGVAIQTAIDTAITTAMAGGGGGGVGAPGRTPAGGGGAGIGEAIATSIATAVAGADFSAVGTALQTALSEAVTTAMTELSTTATSQVQILVNAIAQAFSTLPGAVLPYLTLLGQNIGDLFMQLNSTVPAYVQQMVNTIAQAFGTLPGAVQPYLDLLSTNVTTAFETMGTDAVAKVTAAVASIGAAFQGLPLAVQPGLDGMVRAVESAIASVAAQAGAAEAAGRAIAEGVARGIEAGIPAVTAAADKLVAEVSRAANAAAEIASPSRLFRRETGLPIAQGVALGIEDGTPEAAEAGAGMMARCFDAVQTEMEKGSLEVVRGSSHLLDDAPPAMLESMRAASTAQEWEAVLETPISKLEAFMLNEAKAMGEDAMTNLASEIKSGADLVEDAAGVVTDQYGNRIFEDMSIANDFGPEAGEQISESVEAAEPAATEAGAGLAEAVGTGAEEAVEETLTPTADAVQEFLNSLNEYVQSGATTGAMDFVTTFRDALVSNAESLAGIGEGVGTAVGEAAGAAVGSELASSAEEAMSGLASSVGSSLEGAKRGTPPGWSDVAAGLIQNREALAGAIGGGRESVALEGRVTMDGKEMGDFVISEVFEGLPTAKERVGKRRDRY